MPRGHAISRKTIGFLGASSCLGGLAAGIRSRRRRAALLTLLAAGPVSVPAETPAEPAPAWTEAEVEKDWVLQAHVSPENLCALALQDAAAIIDGVKSGQPEHQTLLEHWAWWEVDLGSEKPLDRIEIFNPRPNRDKGVEFKVTVGATREDFQQVHYLRGPQWTGGHRVIKLDGRAARWVRVWAGGWRDCMQLSEVEVYGVADPADNLARRGRANQSSFRMHPTFKRPDRTDPAPADAAGKTSQPQAAKGDKGRGKQAPVLSPDQEYPLVAVPVAETIARGQALAAALEKLGVPADSARTALADVAKRLPAVPAGSPVAQQLPLYLEARRAIRKLAFANPLLRECDRWLFIKRVPGWATSTGPQFGSDHVRPGGGLYALEGLRSGVPVVRHLTPDFPPGNFTGLELSWDGNRALFAFARYDPDLPKEKEARPEDSFYHLHEMDLKSGQTRQLTHGRYDDLHGAYLPAGGIIFVSTRRASFIQVGLASAQSTLKATFPDCRLRCGYSSMHTLHRMAADGSMLQTLSPTDTSEWYPTVAPDGRILYARWDYVDRDARIAFGLWSCNPDGTQPSIVFGNYTREPYCVFEARPVPGSNRLVFTGSAHHGNTGGPLMLLDPKIGVDGRGPLTNLTPEVGMPEYKVFPLTYYQAPWPLSEEFYLCGWSAHPLTISTRCSASRPNDLGLYLYDAFGNLELIHRDPAINSSTPVPCRPRPLPPPRSELPVRVEDCPSGRFVLANVHEGLAGIPAGAVKRLRIVAVPPRVTYGKAIRIAHLESYEAGKFVLGTVPVESDGSAHFVAPAGVPLWFQALGADGRAIHTMRSVTYLQGGEIASCIGCHEPRNQAPPNGTPLATRRPPSKIRPDVDGSWPLRFDRLVQPVLDRLVALNDPKIAELDLAPGLERKDDRAGKGPVETHAWRRLAAYGGDKGLLVVGHRQDDDSGFGPLPPGQCLASVTPLWDLLTAPRGSPLTPDERARLALWMDTYIPFVGHFTDRQEEEIAALRERWKDLLEPADGTPEGAGEKR